MPCRHVAIGATVMEWESAVNDIADLAGVATDGAEANLHGASDLVTLEKFQVRRIMFCLYELSRSAESFKEAYYAAIEARS